MRDAERLARLLNRESWKNGALQKVAFQRKYLIPPSDGPPNNEPGHRDGESLLRTSDMIDAEILARAHKQSGEQSEGAVTAIAAQIRRITLPDDANTRLFRVYEDPTEDEPTHAVIRFDPDHLDVWPYARATLLASFTRKI